MVPSHRLTVKSGSVTRVYSVQNAATATRGLVLDGVNNRLRWYDRSLTPLLAAGENRLDVTLSGATRPSSRDPNSGAQLSQQWTFGVYPTLDKTPPPAPLVSYLPTNRLQRSDFEGAWPPEVDIRRSAWVLPQHQDAATGDGCVRVVNLMRRDFFSVFLRKNSFDARAYPQLDFDYKFEAKTGPYNAYNMNLVAVANGDMQIVPFIAGPSGYEPFRDNTIGSIAGAQADGAWHHASLDLGAMLAHRYPHADALQAEYLATWATGPRGYNNPQGASLWLDNITLSSPVSSSATFEWRAPQDDNGITGYAFLLDQSPQTLPAPQVGTRQTSAAFKNLRPGTYYFHLRAQDGAGNWGPASQTRFELKSR